MMGKAKRLREASYRAIMGISNYLDPMGRALTCSGQDTTQRGAAEATFAYSISEYAWAQRLVSRYEVSH